MKTQVLPANTSQQAIKKTSREGNRFIIHQGNRSHIKSKTEQHGSPCNLFYNNNINNHKNIQYSIVHYGNIADQL